MGFFTREEARRSKSSRALPIDTVRRLGVSAAHRMNPRAKHPNMQPQLPDGSCDVLVLDGWPTKSDDERGEHFSDSIGVRYRRRIARAAEGLGVGYDYICRTLPKPDLEPTATEIAAFQTAVEETIARAKPRAIIACSHRVVDWFSPGIGYKITVHRGRAFPVEVGGHATWVYPVIGRHNWRALCEKGDDDSSPEEYKEQTWRDLKSAVELREPPTLYPADKQALLNRYQTRIELIPSIAALDDFAQHAGGQISIDIETKHLRPYMKGARILSVALCDGDRLLAMPMDHPEVPVPRVRVSGVLKALLRIFKDRSIVAHNAAFELEWLQFFTNRWVAGTGQWDCTQVGAFTLDTREGQSLDYLCRLYFGLPLKSVSPAQLWNERGAVPALLEYNALDAAMGWEVARVQMDEIVESGQFDAYEYHMERVAPLADMQARGLPIVQDRVRVFEAEYSHRVGKLSESIKRCLEVIEFSGTRGLFNPASDADVAQLFAAYLVAGDDGKISVAAPILEALPDHYQSVPLILDHRDASKKLSTYIRRYLPENPETYIMADGLVHCNYNSTRAQTRRLACLEPNNQNWPARKGKDIRSIVMPDDGYTIVSIDLGQIEARALGMLTLDKQVIRMFYEDYDVHLEWAEILAQMDTTIMDRRGLATMKDWRSQVKNQFVFPAFYGAGKKKISKLTKIPIDVVAKALDKFWKQFAAVKKWQKQQFAFYEANHYVVSPTGFIRRAPLKYNMVINTPIQCTASDICVEGLVRANRIAYERNQIWWTPVMNIHDDLTWIVPDAELDAFIPDAVRAMIYFEGDPRYDFINVPLTCEVTTGKDWSIMQEYGTYRSDQLAA